MSVVSENCGAEADPFLGRCDGCGASLTHANACGQVGGRASLCVGCYLANPPRFGPPETLPARP